MAFETHAIGSSNGQLGACKLTLDIANNTSLLHVQPHQGRVTDDVSTVLQEQEKSMLQLIKNAEVKIDESQKVEEQLQKLKANVRSRADRRGTRNIIDFVCDEQRAWRHHKSACESVYKQSQSKRTGVKIDDVKISESAYAIMGITNAAGELRNLDFQLDVSGVTVNGDAVTFMGYQNTDLNAEMFRGRR
ncbi:hypothetical protein AAFC00_003901 [Neodothiora populina]